MRVSYSEVRRRCLKKDEAIKPLYARLVTHTFSTLLVWLFQNLRISPNQISTAGILLAFLSLPFFAGMRPAAVLCGALCVELYYICDAWDGQWARFTGQKSLSGAFLDYLGNYAIQPPLLFAIAWGVFRQNPQPLYLLLGFTAGFSSLWVILIWNLRSTILLEALRARQAPPPAALQESSSAAAPRPSGTRWLFSWVHKLLVFPWLMIVITLLSLAAFLTPHLNPAVFFRPFLIYYGVTGPVIAVTMTSHWILTRRIDSDLGECS